LALYKEIVIAKETPAGDVKVEDEIEIENDN
jgi:hypothetical protein